jgi:ABC-type branched-subunit amino acid transport system ATPase component
MLLEVRGITKKFGGLTAVSKVSFGVEAGEIVGIFGPNGSGKTTLLNLIMGMAEPTGGDILWKGVSIVGHRPFEIAQHGIAKTFQNPQLFPELSVLDHMKIATHLRLKRKLGAKRILTLSGMRDVVGEFLAAIADVLRLCRLDQYTDRPVSSLSYGAEKMVGVAMALTCDPELLLLDEPTSGLSQEETVNLEDVLRGLGTHGVTMCVIDHRVRFLSRLAPKAIALHHGSLIASGETGAVLRDEGVRSAYLGIHHA